MVALNIKVHVINVTDNWLLKYFQICFRLNQLIVSYYNINKILIHHNIWCVKHTLYIHRRIESSCK